MSDSAMAALSVSDLFSRPLTSCPASNELMKMGLEMARIELVTPGMTTFILVQSQDQVSRMGFECSATLFRTLLGNELPVHIQDLLDDFSDSDVALIIIGYATKNSLSLCGVVKGRPELPFPVLAFDSQQVRGDVTQLLENAIEWRERLETEPMKIQPLGMIPKCPFKYMYERVCLVSAVDSFEKLKSEHSEVVDELRLEIWKLNKEKDALQHTLEITARSLGDSIVKEEEQSRLREKHDEKSKLDRDRKKKEKKRLRKMKADFDSANSAERMVELNSNGVNETHVTQKAESSFWNGSLEKGCSAKGDFGEDDKKRTDEIVDSVENKDESAGRSKSEFDAGMTGDNAPGNEMKIALPHALVRVLKKRFSDKSATQVKWRDIASKLFIFEQGQQTASRAISLFHRNAIQTRILQQELITEESTRSIWQADAKIHKRKAHDLCAFSEYLSQEVYALRIHTQQLNSCLFPAY